MLVEDAAALDGGAGQRGRRVHAPDHQLVRSGVPDPDSARDWRALLVVAAIIAYLVKSGNRRLVRWNLPGRRGRSGRIGGHRRGVHGVVRWQRTAAGESWRACARSWRWACCCTPANWMLSKSSVDAWNRYIRAKTEAAVARIGGTAGTDPTPERLGAAGIVSLALLSFLAVFREGAETVIFYQSIYSIDTGRQRHVDRRHHRGGCADRRLPAHPVHIGAHPDQTVLHRHFVLLAVLVVIFAGGGVHSLIEGDALGGIYLDGFRRTTGSACTPMSKRWPRKALRWLPCSRCSPSVRPGRRRSAAAPNGWRRQPYPYPTTNQKERTP